MDAVVFDLDGVLVDSEHLWDDVRRGLATAAGRPWPPDAAAAMQGVGTADWSRYLAEVVGIPREPGAIAADVIEEMVRRYTDALPVMRGALDAVDRMAAEWRLGLASGSPRPLIDAVLDKTPLGRFFEVAVASDEVAANKPAPDVYLEVVRRLGADPARTAAIEDSSNGLRSASAAGMVVIAVPQEAFPASPEALALADAVLPSLDALTPELVEGLTRGPR